MRGYPQKANISLSFNAVFQSFAQLNHSAVPLIFNSGVSSGHPHLLFQFSNCNEFKCSI